MHHFTLAGDITYSLINVLFTRFLDNLKDYAVKALVNAVDHLGTVAYKLSDIVEQQTMEISSIDLKVACVNQVAFTLSPPHCEFIQQ